MRNDHEDRVEIHGHFIMPKIEEGGISMAGRKPKPTAIIRSYSRKKGFLPA